MCNKNIFIVVLAFALIFPILANSEQIPPEMESWKSWVLHGFEQQLCPTTYNQGEIYHCSYPSRLTLSVEAGGGKFEQHWLIFANGWVALPGSAELFPMQVTVNGQETPVVSRSDLPSIHLTPGEYQVSGRFEWNEIPEMMKISPSVGLVSLSINGKKIDSPVLDKQGQLWLQKRAQSGAQEDMQEISVYRLIDDQIPMQVITNLQINISGQAREIHLNNVLLNGLIPMKIESPLPIRMGNKNDVQIQARPGQWQIRIFARFEGQIQEIEAFADEIWSFRSQNHLRMVEIEGALPIEPKQTDNPSDWKEFPAYIIKPDTKLKFKEIRRGDPDPAPDRLNLERTWWLDFDGQGLTVQDNITGTMSRGWFLAMNPPGLLGRVSVDGVDQLITVCGNDKKAGVELRRGQIELVAESRVASLSDSKIPAVGWDHDVQSLSGKLNLPPGWRLMTASGVDVVPGTWFQRWTLLDFFIMLIIGLGVFKLRNKAWGLLALITMMMIYHEVNAPRMIWLHILAALGLLKVLPEGWIRQLTRLWGLCAVIVLIVISIPFMVKQVRWGIYPQIEDFNAYSTPFSAKKTVSNEMSYNRGAVQKQESSKLAAPNLPNQQNIMSQDNVYRRKQAIFTQDPNAVIQTGPGLPEWRWRTIDLKWNGPVDKSQQIRLWLLPPSINLALAFIRVFLLALLIFGILDLRYWWQTFHQKMETVVATILILLMFNGITYADYPPPELLEELQERLLEKPDCLPNCAEISRMEFTAEPDNILILLDVHAAADTVIPLPGSLESWLPDEVYLGKNPAKGLFKDAGGVLRMLIPKGVHIVTMKGQLKNQHDIQIPMTLKPRRATLISQGWDVFGIYPDGRVESAIRMTRLKKSDGAKELNTAATIPPFLNVERVLHLGLTWQVSVTIRRITPAGVPVVISVPLIEGESVTSSGIHVEKNHVLVNMEPNITEFSWTSALKISEDIKLQAPAAVPWTETWILDASPIWHCDLSGISVIHHQDEAGHWRPTWMPWSGEQAVIKISRPQGIVGQLTTIDSATLALTPGERFVKADLVLNMRSGRGVQHEILLPDQVMLQFVKIADKRQPIRQEGRKVVIPLQPGNQKIDLEWHQSGGSSFVMKSPEVNIGEKAVNAKVTINMPRNRWILWASGPLMGPAVLFWSYFIVSIIASVGLGQIRTTPLKTHHWLLLNLGLTQVHPLVAIMIVGWLLALGARKQNIPKDNWFYFNGTQMLLAIWTMGAMIGFYAAVEAGLLGIPQMQISGNGSSDFYLHWNQDRIQSLMPVTTIFSLPLLVYRCLMLLWALWLASSLLSWLRWAWSCFSEGKIWRKRVKA